MNKIRLTVVAVLAMLIGTVSYAQKGSVTKAESYLSQGDFANAKAEIDVAITIEKNAIKTRTWYARGQIYEAIAKSEDLAVTSVDPQALDKALEAYGKIAEMEKETSSYNQLAKLNLDGLWGAFLNYGSMAYSEENFPVALAQFEKALRVKPNDSTTLLYTGAAAQQAENDTKTLEYYTKMIELGYASENVFSMVIYLTRKDGKKEEALAYTLKAKTAYPDNKTFVSEELSLLIEMNKLDEAKYKLKQSIAEDPTSLLNHLNLAVLYDNLASTLVNEAKTLNGTEKNKKLSESKLTFDSAMVSYKEVLKLDPDNYVASFNIGAILVNSAKGFLDQARDMDLKTYQKNGPALEEKAKVFLKEALPYFVKVITLKPDDLDAHVTLQSIYSTLKMYDEAEKIMNRVEEIEAAQKAGK